MLITTIQQSSIILIIVVFFVGLIIGSFLNVVIYRLPLMMAKNWRRECQEFLALPIDQDPIVFNLLLPGSHCPNCKTAIKIQHNIPIISYLWLNGKCAYCHHAIPWRYPLVELLCAISSTVIAWKFGYGYPLLFALILSWCLIALSFIDIDQQLLPDSITIPLIWIGLFISIADIYTDSRASIIGAISGYLSLWTTYQLFKLATGKQGMGYGDFKLLAVFGAWLGWQYLPLIIMLSAFVAIIITLSLILLKKQQASQTIPFGPYLAIAGWLALLWGNEINNWYFNIAGL